MNKRILPLVFPVGAIHESPLRALCRISGVLALLLGFYGQAPSPVGGQNREELIRTIDGQQQKIQTLVASFSQKRDSSLAKDPLLSFGIVKFKRPGRIHFLYLTPEPLEIALDGQTVWIYFPGRSQAEKYSLTQNRRMAEYLGPVTGIFQKTFGQVSQDYATTYRGLEAGRLHHFLLQPREEKVRNLVSGVDLWIDKNSGAIIRFEMTQVNRDRLSLEFKDLQINPPLSNEDLVIKIPPSVKMLEPSSP